MASWLLTDKEMGELVEWNIGYAYDSPADGYAVTADFWLIANAQHGKDAAWLEEDCEHGSYPLKARRYCPICWAEFRGVR